MYNIFHVLTIKQDITIKKCMNKNNVTKLNNCNNKNEKYKMKTI